MALVRTCGFAVLLTIFCMSGCGDDSAKKIASQRKTIDSLNSELSDKNREIGKLQQKYGSVQEKARELKFKSSSLNDSLSEVRLKYRKLQQQFEDVSRYLEEKNSWDKYRSNAEQKIELLNNSLNQSYSQIDRLTRRVADLENSLHLFFRNQPRDILQIASEDVSIHMESQRLVEDAKLMYLVNWLGKGTQVGDFRKTMKSQTLEVQMPIEIFDTRGKYSLRIGSTHFTMSNIEVILESRIVAIEFSDANDFEKLVETNTASTFVFSYGPKRLRSILEFEIPFQDLDYDDDIIFPLSAITLSGGVRAEWLPNEDKWISVSED